MANFLEITCDVDAEGRPQFDHAAAVDMSVFAGMLVELKRVSALLGAQLQDFRALRRQVALLTLASASSQTMFGSPPVVSLVADAGTLAGTNSNPQLVYTAADQPVLIRLVSLASGLGSIFISTREIQNASSPVVVDAVPYRELRALILFPRESLYAGATTSDGASKLAYTVTPLAQVMDAPIGQPVRGTTIGLAGPER